MKVLNLTIMKKWFDMILSGEKKEEYREIKLYWANRFTDRVDWESMDELISYLPGTGTTWFEVAVNVYDAVRFRNGYSSDKPFLVIECKGIVIKTGKEEWGASPGREYFTIRLGNIISTGNLKRLKKVRNSK